jgi:hypothetical protein
VFFYYLHFSETAIFAKEIAVCKKNYIKTGCLNSSKQLIVLKNLFKLQQTAV